MRLNDELDNFLGRFWDILHLEILERLTYWETEPFLAMNSEIFRFIFYISPFFAGILFCIIIEIYPAPSSRSFLLTSTTCRNAISCDFKCITCDANRFPNPNNISVQCFLYDSSRTTTTMILNTLCWSFSFGVTHSKLITRLSCLIPLIWLT